MTYHFADGLEGFYHGSYPFKEGCVFSVSCNGPKEYRSIPRTVRKDKEGKAFFTWNKKRYYLDDFVAYTPSELVERITSGKGYGSDICTTLLKYGLDSLKVEGLEKPLEYVNFGDVVIGFEVTSSYEDPSEYKWVSYHFVDEYLRHPSDNYKLKLHPDIEGYPKRDFYVDDLASLIRQGDNYRLVAVK